MPKSASLRGHPSMNLLFFDEISLILIDPSVNNKYVYDETLEDEPHS